MRPLVVDEGEALFLSMALVIDACTLAQVPCRFVRRETNLDPHAILGATGD